AESIRDDIMKMPVHRGAMKDSWLPQDFKKVKNPGSNQLISLPIPSISRVFGISCHGIVTPRL
ncbi:hypothetical protein K5D34_04195, partial [Pseudomonas cichorii]|nr:hypothetical protein [Pseudomonas cichorii]